VSLFHRLTINRIGLCEASNDLGSEPLERNNSINDQFAG
jgi:hypothetical protein